MTTYKDKALAVSVLCAHSHQLAISRFTDSNTTMPAAPIRGVDRPSPTRASIQQWQLASSGCIPLEWRPVIRLVEGLNWELVHGSGMGGFPRGSPCPSPGSISSYYYPPIYPCWDNGGCFIVVSWIIRCSDPKTAPRGITRRMEKTSIRTVRRPNVLGSCLFYWRHGGPST